MYRALFILTLLVTTSALTACNGSTSVFSHNSPQIAAPPDKISALLAEAAERASTALETLAAVEYAKSPGVSSGPIYDAPAELRRAISVNWVGPVEPITQKLAERAGYTFRTIGNQTPIAMIVSVDAQNLPVIDVLRDIGLQLGLRADIRVDADRRVVELHYSPITGVDG